MRVEAFLPAALVVGFALLLRRGGPRSGAGGALRLWSPVLFGGLLSLPAFWIEGTPPFLPLAVGLASVVAVVRGARLGGIERLLRAKATPALLGALTALALLFVWGSLDPLPTFHDEASYLLQAKIFAAGRWTAAPPPLPEFFEQYHVFVTPAVAGKYPPGHALALVPGVWLKAAGLVPLLLSAVTGALLYALAQEVSGPWVALATWLFWTTAPGELRFRPSYFSEVTTTALVLTAWWCLLRWNRTPGRVWLFVLAGAVAWGLITRPFTMAAFSIPLAFVLLPSVSSRRRWADLGLASALGGALLLLVPLWNVSTTGDWRITPYSLYSQIYFPYQRPGFGGDPARPERPLPGDMAVYASKFQSLHRAHRLEAMPAILRERSANLAEHMWGGWRAGFLLLALVGLFALPAEARLPVGSVALLFLVYLSLAHYPNWTVYYLEIQPVFAFVTALGLWRVASALSERSSEPSRTSGRALATLSVILLSGGLALGDLAGMRRIRAEESASQRTFRASLRRIPEAKAIVFVRYEPQHDVHRSLIDNEPLLDKARVWIVYDRGKENARLRQLALDRAAYLYDEADRKLVRLGPLDEEGNDPASSRRYNRDP